MPEEKRLPVKGEASGLADILPMLMQALALQSRLGGSSNAFGTLEQARTGSPSAQAQVGPPMTQEQLALMQRFSQGQQNVLPGGPGVNIPVNALYELDKAFGQNVLGNPAGPAWGAWRDMQGLPPETGESTSQASFANFLMSALGSLQGAQ